MVKKINTPKAKVVKKITKKPTLLDKNVFIISD